MTPVKFDAAYSQDLGAGDNPNTGPLPYVICLDRNTPGVCAVMSCWEPSEQELEAIARDKKVYIAVMAPLKNPTQPPVWVMGYDPIAEGHFVRVPEEDLRVLRGGAE